MCSIIVFFCFFKIKFILNINIYKLLNNVLKLLLIMQRMTIDEIVYEYDRKHSQQLVYVALSRVIFNTLFNIIRAVDHGTCYKFYF